ncbi:DUF4124 domain-containing protein [Coralloluteibacterium stylophorae]|uniref:DUF4124 domain-containing protein n=1 Tax=Coralloluteibacterium stylophorae TaxID=1776034 RepID=A0A8J7VUM6_9GAMM|nr:DUF4124 domain-containing protein [Coralloluteibacterium stylophorae]
MRVNRSVALLLACALPAVAIAQDRVYTWVDDSGVRHYSEAPPSSGKYEERTFTQSGASSSVAAATPTAGAAATATAASGGNENCTKAQANVELLSRGVSVVMDRDGDGQPDEPLSDLEKANQLELANAQVKAYCGG